MEREDFILLGVFWRTRTLSYVGLMRQNWKIYYRRAIVFSRFLTATLGQYSLVSAVVKEVSEIRMTLSDVIVIAKSLFVDRGKTCIIHRFVKKYNDEKAR